ncbi:MAG: T9SS type A sorting domain-containing protein [Calditrichaeota bacterium]|nr:T9SS type A sorting domain-containing protein [Calditrichota bacterium]
MKRLKEFTILFAITYFLLLPKLSFPQYAIKSSSFANGSAVVSDSVHQLSGAVGQIFIGTTANALYKSNSGFLYHTAKIVTKVEDIRPIAIPKEFHLDQNYPNPFNPSTTIRFGLPQKSDVNLKIFDLLGREVATLIDKTMSAGEYKVIFEAEGLPTGVYFYCIRASGFSRVKKLTLVK